MSRSVAALLAGGLLATVAVAPAAAADPPNQVVASGLHSPRGLAFGPGGVLYVAEAGAGDGSGLGFGLTGSVAAIHGATTGHPSVRTVVSGLPSAGDTEGTVGPDGVSVQGNGNILVQISLSSEETGLPSPIGRLIKATPSGQWKILANVGDYDLAWSAEHQDLAPRDFPDSNPYAVMAVPGGAFVADAGTNTLDWVAPDGHIAILAYFPNNALADATPTCVAMGPDHAIYVGTLALVDSLGALFDPSLPPPHPAATVYRIDQSAIDPSSMSAVLGVAKPWATGLWPINGCAFGPDGSFYASELVSGLGPMGPVGDVVRIPFADPAQHIALTDNGLSWPGGVAVGPDGHVYVSNMTTSASGGQVVRLP
jgi:hypothetical protein